MDLCLAYIQPFSDVLFACMDKRVKGQLFLEVFVSLAFFLSVIVIVIRIKFSKFYKSLKKKKLIYVPE